MNILSLLLTDSMEEIFSCSSDKGISQVISLLGFGYRVLLIVVPIVIVIFAILKLIKAISSAKDEEIKKAYSGLIKMVVVGFSIFLISSVVLLLVDVIDENLITDPNTEKCINLFLGK